MGKAINPRHDSSGPPESYSGFAVIGGSGAYELELEKLGRRCRTAPLVLETPFGQAAPIHFFTPSGSTHSLAFLSRHGEDAYRISAPDVNYRANVWALKLVGTARIFAWSGPGAIDPKFSPGDYVLADDVIDLTRGRKSTFYENTGLGFIRQNPVFCPEMRRMLVRSLEACGFAYHRSGVCAVTQGPRLETPAEVRMIGRLGGQLVGMTLAPEVFLARELEICYHPLLYVTNLAEGVGEMPHRPGELFEGMLEPGLSPRVDQARKGFIPLILELAGLLAGPGAGQRRCPCSKAMLRYRRSGRIGENWQDWIEKTTEKNDAY